MHAYRFFARLLLGLASAVSFAQQSPVVREALKPSPMEENLRRLTDEIGGRVPGTPAMDKAVQWGIDAFKAAGADSVHTENFRIPASWAEGATRMDVVSPVAFHVRVVSLAWAPALSKATRARIVDVGEGTASDYAKAGDIAGAIVLVHTDVLKTWDDLFNEYFKAPPIIDRAVAGKALAVAFTATREHDILYRHTNTGDGRLDKLPMVLVAREDADRMARLLAHGQNLEAELAIPNKIGGPITTQNVIGELRGSEQPDEYVILGAHLDSWELGTGALDNGCDAALVIDALRAIKAAGVRPRRTIKFILFSGEEEGLLGSWAYARDHQKDLDKIDAVVIFDSGTEHVTGFSDGGRKDIKPTVEAILAPFAGWQSNVVTDDATTGTDHVDFLLEGVPTLVANNVAGNYLDNYHATSDTLDKVKPELMRQHVALASELVFAIANSPQRLGKRLTHAEVEDTMKDTHLDDQLKAFGIWEGWKKGARLQKQ